MAKFMKKFKRTGGYVVDGSKSGRPRTATDEDTSTQELSGKARSSTKGNTCISVQIRISQNSDMHKIRANKWHPYKLKLLRHHTLVTLFAIVWGPTSQPYFTTVFSDTLKEQIYQKPQFNFSLAAIYENKFYGEFCMFPKSLSLKD